MRAELFKTEEGIIMEIKNEKIDTTPKDIEQLSETIRLLYHSTCKQDSYPNCEGCPFLSDTEDTCLLIHAENVLRRIRKICREGR